VIRQVQQKIKKLKMYCIFFGNSILKMQYVLQVLRLHNLLYIMAIADFFPLQHKLFKPSSS